MKNKIKRGASLHRLLEWIYGERILKAIVVVSDRPMISSEIRKAVMKRLDIEQVKITEHIQKLGNFDILKCLTPKLKRVVIGRVYGLSESGIKLRKQLCKRDNMKFSYRQVPKVSWYKYGWVICGSQKLAVIRAIPCGGARLRDIVEKTNEFYVNRAGKEGIKKENVEDILRRMLIRKVVRKGYEIRQRGRKKRIVTVYRLTNMGKLIKNQVEETPVFE